MSTLSVLVVDDEPLARRRLRRMLAACPDVQLVGEAGNVAESCALVRALRPQLVLLDIQMPGGDGFVLLESLGDVPTPEVIFVTAFDHHAVKAFETHAVDYVLKPVEPGRLLLAIDKARRAIALHGLQDRAMALEETIANLRGALRRQTAQVSDFWVQGPVGYERLAMDDILHIRAERDYVRIHTANRSMLHCESMAALQKRLPQGQFMRIHRSSIVRCDQIARVQRTALSGLTVTLSDRTEVRVGRTYRDQLLADMTRRS